MLFAMHTFANAISRCIKQMVRRIQPHLSANATRDPRPARIDNIKTSARRTLWTLLRLADYGLQRRHRSTCGSVDAGQLAVNERESAAHYAAAAQCIHQGVGIELDMLNWTQLGGTA